MKRLKLFQLALHNIELDNATCAMLCALAPTLRILSISSCSLAAADSDGSSLHPAETVPHRTCRDNSPARRNDRVSWSMAAAGGGIVQSAPPSLENSGRITVDTDDSAGMMLELRQLLPMCLVRDVTMRPDGSLPEGVSVVGVHPLRKRRLEALERCDEPSASLGAGFQVFGTLSSNY